MKVLVAFVAVALIGLLVYAQTRPPQVLHAKPTGGQINAFANSETRTKWSQYEGLQRALKTATGKPDPKLVRSVQMYKEEFDKFEKAGDVARIDPKTNLKFLGFYCSATNYFTWSIHPLGKGKYGIENVMFFFKVKLPNGREYFIENSAIQEPRPHVPGEPG